MTKCKHRWHVFAVAVGRFHPAGPRGYRAAPVPDAPVRATRAEAEADHCDALHGTDLWAPKSPRDGGDASEAATQTPQRERKARLTDAEEVDLLPTSTIRASLRPRPTDDETRNR